MKKYLFIFLFLFWPAIAGASSEYEQTFNLDVLPDDKTLSSECANKLIQQFVPYHSGYLEALALKTSQASEQHPGDTIVEIWDDPALHGGSAYYLGGYWQSNTTTANGPYSAIAGYSTTTDKRIYLQAGHKYLLNEKTTYNWRGHTASTTYENSYYWDQLFCNTGYTLSGASYIAHDMYVHWYISDVSSTLSVSFLDTPATSTGFAWWDIDISDDNSSIYKMGVQWSHFCGVYDHQDTILKSDLSWSASSLLPQIGLPGEVMVPKTSQAFQIGDKICAKAFVWDSNGSVLASSTEWEFDVTTSTYKKPPPQCPITSSTIFGWDYGQTTCQIFSYLFIPTDRGDHYVAQLGVIKDDISKKSPFGYVIYFGELDSLSTTTATTTISELSWLNDISFFQYFKTFFAVIFWITFGLYLIWRFSAFQL